MLPFKTIIMPKITNNQARSDLQSYVDALLEGRSTMEQAVSDLIESGKMPKIDVS
jgi:hypothetical protein